MKKFLIIGAIIVLAAVVLNYSLGGFAKLEPGLISTKASVIYGHEYTGRYNSEALDELVATLNGRIETSNGNGRLTIVNYQQEDLEKRGVVKQFVGIIWKDPSHQNKTTFDSLVINDYNGIQFNIPIKPLVMPSPEKLKKLAGEMAVEMNGELAGYSIEQYENQQLIINFPLK